MEVCVDFIDTYRKFFDRFTSSVDPSDQLPVKVAGYNLVECEIPGAVADWTLQYLEQRRCPPFLIAHLVRKVVDEVRVLSKIDPISCGFRGELGDFLSLKLMQVCIAKLVDVCSHYRDNAELSSLPPPHPLPPVTSCAIKNSRRSMEDRHVVIHDFHALFNIKGWGPASYYGVLDGHNGIDAAIYSVSHLHQYLAESPHYPTNPVKALHDACCRTDDMFTIKAERENLHGGTTAVVALLRPQERKLYVAWLGDSQAVLVRHGRPIQIVRPHKPDRPDERDRIEGMGGTVLYWGAWRVNGQLAVSRAIGDVEYKPYVTAEPDIEEITLDGTEDFLILACDGLWDFVTEQQATSTVYKQLQENPEDLEAVSHRLVALSKEQSSQDNISVVVVFLTDPAELAQRPPMETPIPNPFNGAEMFNGQSHRPGPGHFDDEDFGPETDVDMVDDVLLSPAIAAAKALVGDHDDDYERQRQQMKEFDDPGDLDRSRDTPTPPAHEVARDASGDILAESGGEESEEEWNYIPGDDNQNQNQTEARSQSKQEEEDMNSQLNPNAAEFVPVSPKRLLMDDPIIASSPARGFEKSLDNIQLPSELEFSSEISQRPGDLEYSNGPKHSDNHLENFSTLPIKDNGLPSECSEVACESIVNLNDKPQDCVTFDKLAAMQNMEEKVTSAVLEKANIFGTNNDFSNNAFEATNIFGKSDPMTASFMGKDLPSSPDLEDNLVPGTPHSTTVEAPSSPTTDETSPAVHHTELDFPVDEIGVDTQKSPDLISPGDGPHEGITSAQERTSSSGFESESGADEVEPNVISEGFGSEQRSLPMDISFQTIQTFSNLNPFGAVQNPSCTSPLDQDILTESHGQAPLQFSQKDVADKPQDQLDFLQNFASPKDTPNFAHPPNSDISNLETESMNSENRDEFKPISPVKSEQNESQTTNYNTNINDITHELFSDDTNPEIEETSFTYEKPEINETTHEDLSTTEGFLETESKILKDELDCEQSSKKDCISCELFEKDIPVPSPVSPKVVDQVLAAFDDIKLDDNTTELRNELQELRDSDNEVETKEMKLEFESHIATSQEIPEESKNVDEGFEVINNEEITQDIFKTEDLKNEQVEKLNVDFASSAKETNPFMMDDDHAPSDLKSKAQEIQVESQQTTNNDLFSAVDQFSAAVTEDMISSNKLSSLSSSQEPLSSSQEPLSLVEPEVTRVVSYQTLTPADEPQITKSESYITGEKEVTNSTILEEIVPEITKPVESGVSSEERLAEKVETAAPQENEVPVVVESAQKSEPVQNTIVTETLITALEETSEVPSVATTEVPSSAGTPPPTPAPELSESKELQDTPKTDILVAAVAAAGAVAAGSAILAEKETKKGKEVTAKKPAVGAKKPSDVKSSTKSSTTKALPSKPGASKTTTAAAQTKSASSATKLLAATSKPAPAKTSAPSTAAKKPITATTAKTAPPKPAVSAAPKPPAARPPKQLPLSKPATKPPSKPSTPTSKPTTPTTTLASPMAKPDSAKSPARPGLKSPLATKTLAPKSASEKIAEKKPLANGDVKPLAKRTEVPKKTTTTSVKSSLIKPPKTASTTQPGSTTTAAKPKPASATAVKTSAVATKRPNTAPSGKTAPVGGKETVNKQAPRLKPTLNGKSSTAKSLGVGKKTDLKPNPVKSDVKPPPIKKPDDLKKDEEKQKEAQQSPDTTVTTNGFADHNEEPGSLKIEDLAPVTVEIVN